MKINLLNLFIISLASFRLTRLIVFDKITEFIRSPFLDEVNEENSEGEVEIYYVPKPSGISRFMGELLSCYWCTGVWTAAVIVALYYIHPVFFSPVILIFAVAGMASIIETIVQHYIEK